MKKNRLTAIFIFTGTVVIGIITLQIFWLVQMAGIRKNELREYTLQAIQGTVQAMEKKENLHIISDNILGPPDSSMMGNVFIPKEMVGIDSILSMNVHIETDSTTTLRIIHSETSNKVGEETSAQTIRNITLSTYTEKIDDKLKNLDSLMHKIVFEVNERSITDRIQLDSLNSLMKTELYKRGIDIQYELAVFQGDSMLMKTKGFVISSAAMMFDQPLFPGDVIDKNVRLVMYYPVKASTGYMLSKTRMLITLTAVFTLGLLLAFYLTIRTILKQKKLSEMKADFMNNITHEFKTPIATSAIALAALDNETVQQDKERLMYYTGILKDENQKMNEHVEKVLQMSMMEKGKIQLHAEEIHMHELIKDCLLSFELILKEKNAVVHEVFAPALPVVKADPFYTQHILSNVLDNAIKYGGEQPRITITTSTEKKYVVIKIKDEGKGMTPETLKHVFDSFYRGHTGDLHDVKGFGLGLSYVKNILTHMKGWIGIQSEPGKGTTVTLKFATTL